MEDAENRSRLNNLIFYNIPDPHPKDTFAESEEIISRHCKEHLNFVVDPNHIDRAHCLGGHWEGRARPLIVKFNNFKTNESILVMAPNLRAVSLALVKIFLSSSDLLANTLPFSPNRNLRPILCASKHCTLEPNDTCLTVELILLKKYHSNCPVINMCLPALSAPCNQTCCFLLSSLTYAASSQNVTLVIIWFRHLASTF